MKPNSLKAAMVRAAVKKGISDIKDEPKRGIRNLVEMGSLFAGGPFQKDFFAMAMDQLRDENSVYYHIVEGIVTNTREEMLTTFGMNLGFNGLTHGAGIIRSIERQEGFNVPWCLGIELGQSPMSPPLDIQGILEEGKELGIYCYFFFLHGEDFPLEELLSILRGQKDCAFVFFLHPHSLTDTALQSLASLQNGVPVLDMDGVGEDELRRVSENLSHAGSLLGGFSRWEDPTAGAGATGLLRRAEGLNLPILVFLRTKTHRHQNEDDVYREIVKLRKEMVVPVLPIDLCGDIAHADRAISTEACLVTIQEDGSMMMTNVDRGQSSSGYNIRRASLRGILQDAVPKHLGGEGPPSA